MGRRYRGKTYPATSMVIDGRLRALGGITGPDMSRIATKLAQSIVSTQKVGGDVTGILNELSDIASDGVITPVEKLVIKREWENIQSEYALVLSQAEERGLEAGDAEYGAYVGAYDALDAYLNPAILGNLTTSYRASGLGTTLRAYFAAYYQARQDLFYAIEQSTTAAFEERPTMEQILNGFEGGGGTKTPAAVTSLVAISYGRNIVLRWERQANLTNPSHYEIQRGTSPETLTDLETSERVTHEQYLDTGLALDGTEDAPLAKTYYYRVRVVTKAGVAVPWEEANIASAAAAPTGAGDLAAQAVKRAKLEAELRDEHDYTYAEVWPYDLGQPSRIELEGVRLVDARRAIEAIVAAQEDDRDTLLLAHRKLVLVAQEAEKIASIELDIDGLTTTVAAATSQLSQIAQTVDAIEATVQNLSSLEGVTLYDITQLQQQADRIEALVMTGEYAGDPELIPHHVSLVQQLSNQIATFVADGTWEGEEGAIIATLQTQTADAITSAVGVVQGQLNDMNAAAGEGGVVALLVEASGYGTLIEQTLDSVVLRALMSDAIDERLQQYASQIELTSRRIGIEVAERQEEVATLSAQIVVTSTAISQAVHARRWNGSEYELVSGAFLQLTNTLPQVLTADAYAKMLAAIHDSDDRATVAALYDSATYFDGVRWYLKTGITQAEQEEAWDILLAAGVLTSQFLVEAEEIFLHGKVYADHLETDSVQAFIIDTLQLTAYEAEITQLISDRIDVSVLDVTQMANIENLVVAQVLVDADGDPETGFALQINEMVGLLSKYNGETKLQIDPNTGRLSGTDVTLSGVINATDGIFSGTIDSGALLTVKGSSSSTSQSFGSAINGAQSISQWLESIGKAQDVIHGCSGTHNALNLMGIRHTRELLHGSTVYWEVTFYYTNGTNSTHYYSTIGEDVGTQAATIIFTTGGDVALLRNIPSSPTGLQTGQIYRDGSGFLKIIL